MARKNDTLEATEAIEITETTEAIETTEAQIDLTAFVEAVEAAAADADATTGTVPEAPLDGVREQYRNLPGAKPKNAAKAHLQGMLEAAINAGDLAAARAAMQLIEHGLTRGRPASAAAQRKAVDPTEAHAETIAALTLALWLASENPPEGAELSAAKALGSEKATELFADAKVAFTLDEKAEDKLIAKAIRLAKSTSRLRGGGGGAVYGGPRRDIGKHIAEAISALEPGTFVSVAELRAFRSEEYGDDQPSAGAITNRLEPAGGACTLEGVVVERREVNGRSKLGVVVQ